MITKLNALNCPIIAVNESNEADHEQFRINCMVIFKTRPRATLPSLFDMVKDAQGRNVLRVVK